MFLGIREILYARGRFMLIGSVVGMITLLLVMLTGLTGGLGAQNISALQTLNPDRFVFAPISASEEPTVSFTDSAVRATDIAAWENISGVADVTPVGMTQTRMEAATAASVAVIGVPAGTQLPGGVTVPDSGAILSESLVDDTGAQPGATVTLSGRGLPVIDTTADDYYSHSPVVWVDSASWQQIAHVSPDVLGTVLAVNGTLDKAGWAEAATVTGTFAETVSGSFSGLPSYQSEQGSLTAMQGFLYAISALVTISFLTVWTIQRTRDLSILRALGAPSKYLITDALGQAALILGIGVGMGALLGWGLGAIASGILPFLLTWNTVLIPAAGIWLLGLLGAFLATRRIMTIDPMLALGGNA